MSEQIVKHRDLHYDILRVLACFMVIITHSPLPHEGWNGSLLAGLSYFCTPCIGLFFMISGALLLNKQYQEGFDTRLFLKKRFARILWPTLFWFAVGYILSYCGIKNSEIAILWFMFTLAGLYLLTPILYRWVSLAEKKEIIFYLLIWTLSLCYPFLNLFVTLHHGTTSWIYYFYGYAGYFILGYYLAKYGIRRSFAIGMLVSFVLISLTFPILSYIYHWQLNLYTYFWYLSPSVVLQCIFWWIIMKRISHIFEPLRGCIEFVSKHSFGIYLLHVLVLRTFLWKLSWIQSLTGPTQIVICVILTFVISFMLSWLISKLRIGKFIVGV